MSHCKLHLNSDRVSQSMWSTRHWCELPCLHTHTQIFSLGPLPVYQIFCVTMDHAEKETNIWPRGRVTWLSSTSFQMKKKTCSPRRSFQHCHVITQGFTVLSYLSLNWWHFSKPDWKQYYELGCSLENTYATVNTYRIHRWQ